MRGNSSDNVTLQHAYLHVDGWQLGVHSCNKHSCNKTAMLQVENYLNKTEEVGHLRRSGYHPVYTGRLDREKENPSKMPLEGLRLKPWGDWEKPFLPHSVDINRHFRVFEKGDHQWGGKPQEDSELSGGEGKKMIHSNIKSQQKKEKKKTLRITLAVIAVRWKNEIQ